MSYIITPNRPAHIVPIPVINLGAKKASPESLQSSSISNTVVSSKNSLSAPTKSASQLALQVATGECWRTNNSILTSQRVYGPTNHSAAIINRQLPDLINTRNQLAIINNNLKQNIDSNKIYSTNELIKAYTDMALATSMLNVYRDLAQAKGRDSYQSLLQFPQLTNVLTGISTEFKDIKSLISNMRTNRMPISPESKRVKDDIFETLNKIQRILPIELSEL